jgi:hypothetical protein
MGDQGFYRTIHEERRRLAHRQATDEIREIIETLNRLLFGEGRVRPEDEPADERVIAAHRLMPVRQHLKLALRALQEAEECPESINKPEALYRR